MRGPIEQRLFAKVEKTDTCWLWKGSRTGIGHGVIGVGVRGKGTVLVHRVSWELANGKVPDGMCVLHKCDVPNCVNPSHLWLGTYYDNNHDMWLKGRHRYGAIGKRGRDSILAKWTAEQIEEMRILGAKRGQKARVAKMFGASVETVRRIVRREGCYGNN